MNFKLENAEFEFFKHNVPDSVEYLKDISQDEYYTSFTIKNENVQEVQLLINDEIVSKGMDKQNTVNTLGVQLYKLYDDILAQKRNQ